MQVTGTHINYYLICRRKLWLFASGMNMEHTSDLVTEGKLIHETSYPQRSERYTELEIEGIKIDYYDARNRVVHEVKRGNSREEAHAWQVKYYLYVLRRNGVEGATGILEYPKLRQTEEIDLSERDCTELAEIEANITELIASETCPARLDRKHCRSCSYEDFCWTEE
jgi:CRISPR-associated exonuclease Cas4